MILFCTRLSTPNTSPYTLSLRATEDPGLISGRITYPEFLPSIIAAGPVSIERNMGFGVVVVGFGVVGFGVVAFVVVVVVVTGARHLTPADVKRPEQNL